MFENPQITQLPAHQNITFEPLADNAVRLSQINSLLFYIPLALVLAAVCYFNQFVADYIQTYLIVFTPVVIIAALTFDVISVKHKGVAVRSHDIAYRRGVIWQQITILPLSRVQHTEIHRGPIERKLGLATLRLYSAGGMSADLHISGLTEQSCNDMRQFIQDYTQQQNNDEDQDERA